MIIETKNPVTLIGGAQVKKDLLGRALPLAPTVVAADGGADSALACGAEPEAVIGDFDSISDEARKAIPADRLFHVPEQETTDFDKCLRNIDAPLVIGVGFSGDRTDHFLASCNTLVRHPERRCILVGDDDLVFLAPPAMSLELEPDTTVSLFPMGAVEGVSEGLNWPIAGLNFTPDGRVGTSNRATGPVWLTFTSAKMLVILPVDQLAEAARAILAARDGWPPI